MPQSPIVRAKLPKTFCGHDKVPQSHDKKDCLNSIVRRIETRLETTHWLQLTLKSWFCVRKFAARGGCSPGNQIIGHVERRQEATRPKDTRDRRDSMSDREQGSLYWSVKWCLILSVQNLNSEHWQPTTIWALCHSSAMILRSYGKLRRTDCQSNEKNQNWPVEEWEFCLFSDTKWFSCYLWDCDYRAHVISRWELCSKHLQKAQVLL